MRGSAFTLALAAVLWAAALPLARAADTPVDLELILAVDVSRSMDTERDGYVAALTHPDVVARALSAAFVFWNDAIELM